MKKRILSCISILLISFAWANGQSLQLIELTAEYGPPSTADSFELFTFPITPETFNVDSATLLSVLENITSFRIRTEMHTGNDVGGVDNILVGSSYSSYFDNSLEAWSSGGDGTLEWESEGGYSGGFIQISDWATGALHWVIAPISWAGDWSGLLGDTISFYFKTNKPSYNAEILLTNAVVKRLVLNAAVSTVALNDSTKIKLEVAPVPSEDLIVDISSSANACLTAPVSVIVPAEQEYIELYVSAATGATIGCESVIEATSSGYEASRVTMSTVEDNAGITSLSNRANIQVYPNPCSNAARLRYQIHDIRYLICDIYSISGIKIERLIDEGQLPGEHEIELDVSDLPAGVYFVKLQVGDDIIVRKLVVSH